MSKLDNNSFVNMFTICISVFLLIVSGVLILNTFNVGGFKIYIVKSGSMQPAIKTGSLVLDKKETFYLPQDIISYSSNTGETVTHRVVDSSVSEGVTKYIVKGDANNAADGESVDDSQVIGKVIFSMPFLGYFVALLKTLPGVVLFIILPGIIIIYKEFRTIEEELKKIFKERKANG